MVPWWVRYCRLGERWSQPPWRVVAGTRDDRHWSRDAWVLAQGLLDDADDEVATIKRAEKR